MARGGSRSDTLGYARLPRPPAAGRLRLRRRGRCEQRLERLEGDEGASAHMNRLQLALLDKFPQLRVSQAADLFGGGYRDGERRHALGFVGRFCAPNAHRLDLILNESPRAGTNDPDMSAELLF